MDHSEIVIDVPPEDVWATLADGSSFDKWVVGCQGIRAQEGTWPAVGSSIHHTVGVGPATIDDTTTVEVSDPPRRLVLRAKAGPVGVARVDFALTPLEGGRTCVAMEEGPVEGPAARIPEVVADVLLAGRNAETLSRLKQLVEERAPMRE